MFELLLVSGTILFIYFVHRYSKWHSEQKNIRLEEIKKFFSIATKLLEDDRLTPNHIQRLRFLSESIDQKESFDSLLKAIQLSQDDTDNHAHRDLPSGTDKEWAQAFWHWMRAVSLRTPIKQYMILAAFSKLLSPTDGPSIENKLVELDFRSHLTA